MPPPLTYPYPSILQIVHLNIQETVDSYQKTTITLSSQKNSTTSAPTKPPLAKHSSFECLIVSTMTLWISLVWKRSGNPNGLFANFCEFLGLERRGDWGGDVGEKGGVGRLCGLYDLDVVSVFFVVWLVGGWEGWRCEGSVVGPGGVVEDGLGERAVHLLLIYVFLVFVGLRGWLVCGARRRIYFLTARLGWVWVGLCFQVCR